MSLGSLSVVESRWPTTLAGRRWTETGPWNTATSHWGSNRTGWIQNRERGWLILFSSRYFSPPFPWTSLGILRGSGHAHCSAWQSKCQRMAWHWECFSCLHWKMFWNYHVLQEMKGMYTEGRCDKGDKGNFSSMVIHMKALWGEVASSYKCITSRVNGVSARFTYINRERGSRSSL